MTEISLLSPEDLCIEIISLRLHYDIQHDDLPAGLGKLYKSIPFPQIQQNEIKSILKEIQSKKLDYYSILLSHKIVFHFNLDYVSLVSDYSDNLGSQTSLISATILYMYLAWCLKCYQNNKVEYFQEIFYCLIKLINNHACNVKLLILSALNHCLLIYFDYNAYNEPKNALKYLTDFFSLPLEFPNNAFNVIELALELSMKSDNLNENDLNELMLYIGTLCEEKRRLFPNKTATTLSNILMPSLSELSIESLSLYTHLVKHLLEQTNLKIFSVFANSILNYIQKDDPNITVKTVPPYEKSHENNMITTEVTLRFWDKPSFINGINLKIDISFPERVSIHVFIREDILNRLNLIITAGENNEKLASMLLETFSSILPSLAKEEYKWDLNLIFLYLCFNFFKYIGKNEALILLSPPFFSPNQTIFNQGDDFYFISSTRSAIIQTLLKSPKGLSELAFTYWMQEPMLFAEIIHRIIINRQLLNFGEKNRFITPFCKSFMTVSLFYQQLHYLPLQENSIPIESIEIARTSLLILISNLLSISDNNIAYLLWSNHYFISFFLSFLFEPSLQSFVLTHLLAFLSKCSNDVPANLLDILQQIMQICFPSFPNEEFVNLVSDIILTLNDALIHQRSITKSFEQFCSLFFSSSLFSVTIANNSMQNFILQCIQFFSLVATPNDLGIAQYSALEKAITTVFGTILPQTLSNKLIQLIAGDNLASLNPTFFIRNPEAVKMLVRVSIDDPKLVEVINFIEKLVSFSNINALILRQSDFDFYLIECIKNQSDIKILDAFLRLFYQISCVVSSVSVVHKYISLLSPYENQYYSDFQEQYIRTINNIVSTSLRIPPCSLKMFTPNCLVDIIGINYSEIENGFTFICWVQLDTPKVRYMPNLLRISDSKGNTLSVFVSASYLYCQQITPQYESTGKVETPIPKSNTAGWSFIALTFSYDDEISFITPYFGVKPLKSLEFYPMKFQPGPISCKIAGVTPDSNFTETEFKFDYLKISESDLMSRMSTFGLFTPLNGDLISAIYQLGPRGGKFLPSNPICFFTSEEDNGVLVLNQIKARSVALSHSSLTNSTNVSPYYNTINSSSSFLISRASSLITYPNNIHNYNIEAKLHDTNIQCDQTFTQILVKFCKLQTLLPLFNQFDMTAKNGSTFPIEKATIELFEKLLSTSVLTQKSFYNANGVKIINHLLYSITMKKINYSLYAQFFSLMQSISYEPLQIQFIKDILIDCELWIRADADNHIRILKHWDRTLFPSILSLISSYSGLFQQILYIMRAYYWYNITIEEQEYIKCPTRANKGEMLNIAECRQLLSRIALLIATQSFTNSDFNCLSGHCLTCSEQQQVVDLLQLLRSLGQASPSPLGKITGECDFISFLYSLIPRRNYIILSLIFEIIITFYKQQLINSPPLHDQIALIMIQLSPSKITTDFFFDVLNQFKMVITRCFLFVFG